ncbi:MAG: serine/threonine protein kinase [Planctomycetes bacterium]|nr:serine/threonine protein kinase [Planctomycetota bacterium]
MRAGVGVQPAKGNYHFFLDRPITGLENAVGKFFHGLAPGPHGPEKPIPVFLQLLETETFGLNFSLGDPAYQVLANDQNRFALPRALPPILSLLAPGEDENPSGSWAIIRHAYSEGAFQLLHDAVSSGYRFPLKEFLRFSETLAEALSFLHGEGIAHGQWNCRSILCIPLEPSKSPFDDVRTYRFDLLNTGVRFLKPEAIPEEFLGHGYYPPELFLASSKAPDFDAYDLETDVYCFSAFLRDLFQRATSFEDLAKQAAKIREHLSKEMLRRGQAARPELLSQKEQEILDHLYTIKAKTESIIQAGLGGRRERCDASYLKATSSELYQKAAAYAERLFQSGQEPINVFGDRLQHYAPYKIAVAPPRVNNFETTVVAITGEGLPQDVVRISLGDYDQPMAILEASASQIRFQIPFGFPAGTHAILINNRRTDQSVQVTPPAWKQLLPGKTRKPWAGFGNIAVRVVGQYIPAHPLFSLETSPGSRTDALKAQLEPRAGFEGEAPSEECIAVEFPEEAPVGSHRVLCNGLDTGLCLEIEEALPDPAADPNGLEPKEVLNHREQKIHLRGHNFHPQMIIDLGEGALPGGPLPFKLHSDKAATLALPAGIPPGEYRLRVNRRECGLALSIRKPHWKAVNPLAVRLTPKEKSPVRLQIQGEHLPQLSKEAGDEYFLLTSRGKKIPAAVLQSKEVEPGEIHELQISPQLQRGVPKIYFGDSNTGLNLKVRRKLPASFWAAAAILVAALTAGAWLALAYHYQPVITGVENNRVFNFGDSKVLLTARGGKLLEVILRHEKGPEVKGYAVQPWADKAGGYFFRPAGAPPGNYSLIPRGRIFRGKPAEAPLAVESPAFQLEPQTANRLMPLALNLSSKNRFPIEKEKFQKLTFKSRPGAPGKEPPEKGPEKNASKPEEERKEPPPLARGGKDVSEPGERVEFSIPFGAMMPVKAGTFKSRHEGEYEVFLDGTFLSGEFTASSEPLSFKITGPRIEGIQTNPATLDAEKKIQISLKGSGLPQGLPLQLISSDKQKPSGPFRLEPEPGGGFRGEAAAGKYSLAWDLGKEEREEIPGLSLEVYPAPEVLAVTPAAVPPETKVELTLNGINLRGAGVISLKPLSGDEGALTFAIDSSRLRQEEGAQSEYQLESLELKTGKYAVGPGEKAILEVVENCQKLLDAYTKDLSGQERLIRCLGEIHAKDEVRRAAAGVFFDQGFFAEALPLYRKLGDLPSRFRAAFLSQFLEAAEGTRFTPRAEDPPGDPFYRAAVAMGWVEGKSGEPPLDPSGTWDVDFARGYLASDPRIAIEALTLSIQKKASAALVKEIQPFAPAFERLATAQLDLAVYYLAAANPLEARDHLRRQFFTAGGQYELLSENDRARCCFFYGHALVWYSGDEAEAIKYFQQGMAFKGHEYATLCRKYLEGLGAEAGGDGGDAAGESSWGWNFLTAVKYYYQVRNSPNYNILTEMYDFRLFPEERNKSLDLHRAIRRLESSTEIRDPFAQNALLFYLRHAQLLSWPGQEGGRRAREHRERLLGFKLGQELQALRDFFLLEGEVGSLETAQIAILPGMEAGAYLKKANELLSKPSLPESFKERLKRLQRKLQLL